MEIRGHTLILDLVPPPPSGIYTAVAHEGKIWTTGKTLYNKHNVITNQGKTRCAQLLGGLDANAINKMAIGDQGAPIGSPSAPFIPLATDTNLSHRISQTTSVNPVVIGVNQLRFTALFLTSPPVPFASPLLHAINEVGLFFADDNIVIPPAGGTSVMFARNTFPSIPFDPGDREGVLVTWTITIV